MSELRQDRTTGFRTIIAPERNERPHKPAAEGKSRIPAHDASCPFCPGNEVMLPSIIEETPRDSQPGWQTRVVPNKFPILDAEGAGTADPPAGGYGLHEVIIETPRHNAGLADLAAVDMQAVVETWHQRFTAALAQPGIETVLVFRNHGRAAGASLRHSHSQLVAMPTVAPRLSHALAWALGHHEETHECVTCKEQVLELESDQRVVELTDDFAVLVPYAASSPFEQWIVPRRHAPSFLNANAQERTALAGTLQRALHRFKAVAGDLPCNLAIEPGSSDTAYELAVHWSMRIVPAITTPGGFEMLSGIRVNPSRPEDDAQRLRDCRIDSA